MRTACSAVHQRVTGRKQPANDRGENRNIRVRSLRECLETVKHSHVPMRAMPPLRTQEALEHGVLEGSVRPFAECAEEPSVRGRRP